MNTKPIMQPDESRPRPNTLTQRRRKTQKPGNNRKPKPIPSTSNSGNQVQSKTRPKGVIFDLSDVPMTTKPPTEKKSSDQLTPILKPQEPVIEDDTSGEGLHCTDKLVIYTLWTSEILYIVVHACTHRFIKDKSHGRTGRESHGSIWHDALLTCSICIIMLLVGLCGDYFGRRFLILLSSLSVFSLSPILGVLSLHIGGLQYVLMWIGVFWYATVPCRIWLIYHQKFPLPIHDTHITATVNELLIEISEWLCVVFIEGSKVNFSYSIYLTVWTLALCAAIGYSVATYFIRNYVNSQPSDIEFVRGVYRKTEVIHSFEHRHENVSVIVFLFFLYLGGVFSIVKEYLAVSILHLSRKVHYPSFGGIIQYRLDLIVSGLTITIVELQLSLLKTLRGEMKDLILIAIAHFVNIVVLVLLLIAVSKSERSFLTTEELNFGSLEFFYPVHYHPFFLECDGHTMKSIRPTVSGFGLVVNGQRDVLCRGWTSDDGLLFHENVTLRENLRTVYLIRKPRLVRVDSFDTWKSVSVSNIVLMNAVDFCTTGRAKLNLSNLCSKQSVCLPLQVEMVARSAKNETLLAQEIHFPRVNKTSDFIALPKLTAEIEIWYNHTVTELRELMHVADGKFLKPHSWPLHRSFSIGPDPTIIVLFFFSYPKIACLPLVDANYLKSYYADTEMIAPSVLMGIALGVAAVGYIHFMWTQSPVQWRTSIIAVYFTQHFLFAWVTRTCLLVNVSTATSVLVIQCVSTLVHLILTYWSYQRLPPVQQKQLKQKGGQRF